MLGPPRTLRGVLNFAKPCKQPGTRVHVRRTWVSQWPIEPGPQNIDRDIDDARTFTLENLGPGNYEVWVRACDHQQPQEWSAIVRGSDLVGRTLEIPLALVDEPR